ncbi:hypothetical protein DL96DRAFT_1677575 [Flagelloscypha sp. PMI_526]|nr:hypothetical protein DL96DRAFT_1677575 [Flagelloscypha sp. PMI_526]
MSGATSATDILLLLVLLGPSKGSSLPPPKTDDSEPAHVITVVWDRFWTFPNIEIARSENLNRFVGQYDTEDEFEEMVAQQVRVINEAIHQEERYTIQQTQVANGTLTLRVIISPSSSIGMDTRHTHAICIQTPVVRTMQTLNNKQMIRQFREALIFVRRRRRRKKIKRKIDETERGRGRGKGKGERGTGREKEKGKGKETGKGIGKEIGEIGIGEIETGMRDEKIKRGIGEIEIGMTVVTERGMSDGMTIGEMNGRERKKLTQMTDGREILIENERILGIEIAEINGGNTRSGTETERIETDELKDEEYGENRLGDE